MHMRTTLAIALAVAAALAAPPAEAAQAPWHAAGWSHRAVVKVTTTGTAGVDVAQVRVLHAGAARDDGADYRLFDAAGQPVPYEVTYHAPGRDTLISFRAAGPGGVVYVYFGKADAPADPMRAVADARPGAGPPKAGAGARGWIPRAGLVLTTLRRPEKDENPKTVEEMAGLIARSAGLDGAGYRRNISDGVNPFGDSDYFISVYRGWIRLPATGTYGFCTASNEASFSFLDGKPLVHWPGRHTEQRGKFGQKDAEVEVAAGLHYVEYYHEEVLLYQVAFLGYRPPGGPHHVGIPDDLFPQPHRAEVARYEAAGGAATVLPRIELTDSVWPRQRPAGQYTRYRFAADAGTDVKDLAGWSVRWDFGDGQTATVAAVDHVYLATGRYDVTMTASGPGGAKVERRWPLAVFPIEHLAEGFKAGSAAAYRPIVAGYDRAKLATAALAELMRFLDETGAPAEAAEAAQGVLSRPDATAADKLDAHLALAGAGDMAHAWRSTPGPRAADHLRAALEAAEGPVQRMRVLARLIRHAGVDQGDVETAAKTYAEAEALLKKFPLAGGLKRAFRDATIAAGDARVAAGRLDEAGQDYRTAEALAEPVIPEPVRVARIGAYPERLTQLITAGKPDEAREVVQEWYEEFPSDVLRGEVLFWMGKVEGLCGRTKAAVRPLRMAIDLGQGSAFEAEGRWLLAEAHRQAGDRDAQRAELAALVRSGLAGEWRDKAAAALKDLPKP